MNATELRIGNMVSYEATTHIIRELHTDKVLHVWAGCTSDGYYSPYDDMEPIPLSASILEQMGFTLSEDLGDIQYYQQQGARHGYGVSKDHEEWAFYKFRTNTKEEHEIDYLVYDEPHFLYVHQLQNLYHALTGYELTLQTTPQP
jgi:hypothetical protein